MKILKNLILGRQHLPMRDVLILMQGWILDVVPLAPQGLYLLDLGLLRAAGLSSSASLFSSGFKDLYRRPWEDALG